MAVVQAVPVALGSGQALWVLENPAADFSAKFCAAAELNHIARRDKVPLEPRLLESLARVLASDQFASQRQRIFLFREAADTLVRTAVRWPETTAARRALGILKNVLASGKDQAHRAAAEALGSLPLKIPCLRVRMPPANGCRVMSWNDLLAANDLTPAGEPLWKGRSLVVPLQTGLLVVKFARAVEGSLEGLMAESRWMSRLAGGDFRFEVDFSLARPLGNTPSACIRLVGLPWKPPGAIAALVANPALVYLAPENYFDYPNEQTVDFDTMNLCLGRCGWLLGHLARRGVIHTAPIALFHNRVQRHRRRDQGRYQWFRAGRLDRWLESCRYPNLALCGLRDFEHLETVGSGGMELYRHLGSHFLSLLLLAASWFRNRCPELVGRDSRGRPTDARHLFNHSRLVEVLENIYLNYYNGFCRMPHSGRLLVDFSHLAQRMIEEMGVDRHMEEVLRVADQNQMDRRQFEAFLLRRGYSKAQALEIDKGAADIVIMSGPHLGGFNRPISLPELIQAVATMAATCIADSFDFSGTADKEAAWG